MAKKSASAAERRHLDRVAQLPCMVGKALGEDHGPVEVHHIREGQGMAQRASHWLAVPLCPACHRGQNGLHGSRVTLRIAGVEELDLLALTIEELSRATDMLSNVREPISVVRL